MRNRGEPEHAPEESVHDVLAAEEFEVGGADPALHHGQITVPPEPGAGPRAHDVLAADEFAVPAGPAAPHETERTIGVALGRRGVAALLAVGTLVIAARRRRSD